MAVAIHLIVRYRELLEACGQASKHQLILDTVLSKLRPCVYATLTTMAGFGSLVLCDILPVKTFGWIMITGLIVSLLVTFLLFPSILILLPPEIIAPARTWRFSLTSILARFTQAHGTLIVGLSVLALMLSAIGIRQLKVENSFIDYFKSSTEIYQGMKVIDQELGGTTPLDITIDFGDLSNPSPWSDPVAASATEDDDEFAEFAEFEDAGAGEKYWFTPAKMTRIREVHDYLDGLPETGKVLSLATTLKIAENLNQGQALDNLERAVLFNETPDELKDIMVRPYASIEHNQARLSVRVRDSDKTLRRNELLKRIQHELTGKLGFESEQVRLAGMLVLYNNMLQSLFSSQIRTLGLTVLALMIMFLILFRSLKIALIALFPNVLSVSMVLGIMGWLGIPLDMMTITIAAISVGIAVDDTIHYIHRFKQEFQMNRDYITTLHRCHGSIGRAMYYTSVTIIIGFSILALSNFIPSIYFGLLTGLAMFIALIAALTLLPQMLIIVKPFGKEHESTE
jgi:predicted RND superfamily exporter protein